MTHFVDNDRPPTCRTCTDIWARRGWTFPLPITVSEGNPA